MTLSICPECGLAQTLEDTCRNRFDNCLGLEFTDSAYFQVHHLTVAAYMLQHPSQLSAEGWVMLRDLLQRFLDGGETTTAIRTQLQLETASNVRQRSLKRDLSLTLPADFVWQEAIPNVGDALPQSYCQEIESWARSVVVDATKLSS